MTMAEVLEGIAKVGRVQERILKRVKSLEAEVGMEDDPDDDNEKEPKDPNDPDTKMDPDDEDKDRGRSTRTPGQTMTRAQMHRAAKEKDKLARSGKYGNIGINPNPGPSRNKAGDAGMTVGAMLRSALTGGASKTGYRELEVLEENHISYDRDHLVIPWDFLAEYGRHAAKVERQLPNWEPKEIQAGYVRQVYDTLGKDGHVRTITSAGSSGAGASITAFDRAVVTAAESQLRKNNATGENLFWVLSNAMIEVAVDKRIGGTDAIVFLAQRDPEKFREGLIGGTTAGLGSRYVETGELGRPHGTAYKQTAIGIVGFGSQMVPIFFGQGIEFRLNRLTDTTNTNYSLQMALSFVQANTKNAEAIGQAVS